MSLFFLSVEVLSSFIEVFIVMETMTKLFGVNRSFKSFYIHFIIYLSVISIGSILFTVYVPLLGAAALWGFALNIAFSAQFLNGKIYYKIITLLILFLVIFSIDILLLQILSAVFMTETTDIMIRENFKAVFSFSSKFLLFIVTRAILFSRHKELNKYNKGYWWISGVISVFSICVMLLAAYIQATLSYQMDNVYIVSSIAVLFAVNVVAYYLILRISNDNLLINKNNLTNQYNEILIKHYKEIENSNDKIKKIYHDFNSHLQYLEKYAENEEYDKLKLYIQNIKEETTYKAQFPKTGNTSVDAILEFKLSKAAQKGINIIIVGVIPERKDITDFDLCSILSNIVENASEACDLTDDARNKFIRCSFSVYKGFLSIEVTNPAVRYKDDLSTTKPDKELHGIGLESVRMTVKKYDGFTYFGVEDGIFRSKILI